MVAAAKAQAAPAVRVKEEDADGSGASGKRQQENGGSDHIDLSGDAQGTSGSEGEDRSESESEEEESDITMKRVDVWLEDRREVAQLWRYSGFYLTRRLAEEKGVNGVVIAAGFSEGLLNGPIASQHAARRPLPKEIEDHGEAAEDSPFPDVLWQSWHESAKGKRSSAAPVVVRKPAKVARAGDAGLARLDALEEEEEAAGDPDADDADPSAKPDAAGATGASGGAATDAVDTNPYMGVQDEVEDDEDDWAMGEDDLVHEQYDDDDDGALSDDGDDGAVF